MSEITYGVGDIFLGIPSVVVGHKENGYPTLEGIEDDE